MGNEALKRVQNEATPSRLCVDTERELRRVSVGSDGTIPPPFPDQHNLSAEEDDQYTSPIRVRFHRHRKNSDSLDIGQISEFTQNFGVSTNIQKQQESKDDVSYDEKDSDYEKEQELKTKASKTKSKSKSVKIYRNSNKKKHKTRQRRAKTASQKKQIIGKQTKQRHVLNVKGKKKKKSKKKRISKSKVYIYMLYTYIICVYNSKLFLLYVFDRKRSKKSK